MPASWYLAHFHSFDPPAHDLASRHCLPTLAGLLSFVLITAPSPAGAALHFTTSLRLRGGKSFQGQGAAASSPDAAGQGVQLPLLRNVLDFSTSLSTASNVSAPTAGDGALGVLDPERMAFLRNAFAEMLENTTDVFATAISRLSLPEDCEANISLKERALFAIAGWPLDRARSCFRSCFVVFCETQWYHTCFPAFSR